MPRYEDRRAEVDLIAALALEEKIAGLPSWARRHITLLQRERDLAIRQHESFAAGEPGAPFFIRLLAPQASAYMPIERATAAMCVGCRVGNIQVELRPCQDGSGVEVKFDHRDAGGSGEAGRAAIKPLSSNMLHVVDGG